MLKFSSRYFPYTSSRILAIKVKSNLLTYNQTCFQHKALRRMLLRAGQPSSLAGGLLRQQLPVVPERGRGGAPLALPRAAAAAAGALHRARRRPAYHAYHI